MLPLQKFFITIFDFVNLFMINDLYNIINNISENDNESSNDGYNDSFNGNYNESSNDGYNDSYNDSDNGEYHPRRKHTQRRIQVIEEWFNTGTIIRVSPLYVSEQGVLVKVSRYKAFLPYNLMPWRKGNVYYWQTIFPFFIDNFFQGKIVSIRRGNNKGNNRILITFDATATPVQPYELKKDVKYTGIIISATNNLINVDIGIYFNWECGSIYGMMHRNNIDNNRTENDLSVGKLIDVYLQSQQEHKNFFIEANYFEKNKKYINLLGTKLLLTKNSFCKEDDCFYIGNDKMPAKIIDNDLIIKDIPDDKEAVCKVRHIDAKQQFLVLELQNKFDIINLSKDIDYTGTIFLVRNNNLLIDIGESFDWKYGHVVGKIIKQYLPQVNDITEEYAINDKIIVRIKKIQKSSLLFYPNDYKDTEDMINTTIILNSNDFNAETGFFHIGNEKYQIIENKQPITEIPENKNITCLIRFFNITNGAFVTKWISKLEDIDFAQNIEYKAIVIYVGETYLLADLGIHFDFKYGKIQALVLCDNTNIFEVENEISVFFKEKTQKGLIFYENQKYKNLTRKIAEFEKIKQNIDTIVIPYSDFRYDAEKEKFLIFDDYTINFTNHGMYNHLKNIYNTDSNVNIYFKIYNISFNKQIIYLECINGKNETAKLEHDVKYSGYIVRKSKNCIFVEIGHCFNWEYGAITVLIAKQNCINSQFKILTIGNTIDIYCKEINKNECAEFFA